MGGGVLPVRGRRRECARDDHFRRGVGGVPLREPGGVRVAGRVEVGVRLVDPVVDQPDLDPLARGGEVRAPERGGADQVRAGVGGRRRAGGGRVAERVIRDGRPDGDARERAQAREIRGGEEDGDAVECDAVVPTDTGRRNRRRRVGPRACAARPPACAGRRPRPAREPRGSDCAAAAAVRVRSCATSTASEGRGKVTTTSTSLPDGAGEAAAPPPASSVKPAARASASGSNECRKRAAWYVRLRCSARRKRSRKPRPISSAGASREMNVVGSRATEEPC